MNFTATQMMLNGQVENWNIVFDLDNMSLMRINIGSMKKMISFL